MNNILIDLSYIRQNLYQGVGKYAYRFLDFLVENKHTDEFTLLINTISEKEVLRLYPQFKYITIGPSFFRKIPIIRTLWTSYKFKSTIDNSNFDVIFCPWANEITCLKTKKKVISVIHDFQLRKDLKGLRLQIQKQIDNNIIKNSDKIITISDYSKKDIIHLYPVISEKIFNLGNSVSFNTEIGDSFVNHPYILFVGRLSKMKNPLTLVKAYIRISHKIQHDLVIVGDKTAYWENEIAPLIRKENLDNRIISISGCSDSDLNSLYKHSDLFVFPSLREGFGSPPLEAAMMKTSVIISECESLPEISLGLFHTYSNPFDFNELSDLILQILNNPDSAEKLESIANQIENTYNINIVGKRIYNFIKNC